MDKLNEMACGFFTGDGEIIVRVFAARDAILSLRVDELIVGVITRKGLNEMAGRSLARFDQEVRDLKAQSEQFSKNAGELLKSVTDLAKSHPVKAAPKR